MAHALVADGRAAEVARMLEPLLGSSPNGSPALSLRDEARIRCLLARIRLLEDRDVEGARRILAPVAAHGALNDAGAGVRAEVALWLGWCDLLADPDAPGSTPATRLATAALLLRAGGAAPESSLWCNIGLAFVAVARGCPGVAVYYADMARRLQQAIRSAQAERVLSRLPRTEVGLQTEIPDHVWTGGAMERVARIARLAAADETGVLIVGERGTGRRHLARAIHRLMYEPAGAFRVLHGADRMEAENQIELEHALSAKDRPTVCLHEADALPASLQRMAATAHRAGTIRLICTTTHDVCTLAESGRMDASLLEACALLQIEIPPLRDRKEDVELLVRHFLRRLGTADGLPPAVTDDAMTMLVRYPWPGNVRQLRNEIERALVHVQSEPAPVIRASVLSPDVRGSGRDAASNSSEAGDLDRILAQTERAVIESALVQTGGQVAASADRLGLSRQGLYKKMKRLGVDPARYQNGQEPTEVETNV